MSFWDQRFAEGEYAYGTEPNDFIREQAHQIPPGRVLCLAEGQGRNAVFLAGQGRAVTAVDASAVGLRRGAELARQRGVEVEWVHADLADHTFAPSTYAGVVIVFGHLPPALRRRVHASIAGALIPGGAFVAEYYRPGQLAFGTGGPPEVELLVSAEDLRAELIGLQIERLDEVERTLSEGRYHQGPSATVQVVARKAAR